MYLYHFAVFCFSYGFSVHFVLLEPLVDQLYTSFERPTIIQSVSWPIALSGRDLIGIAQTGSGKTIAFMLPAMIHILNQQPLRPLDGPIVSEFSAINIK